MNGPATTPANARVPRLGARAFVRRAVSGDFVAQGVVALAAAAIVGITVLLIYELWVNSVVARTQFGWGFLTTQVWDPVNGEYGALPFIYGTVVTSAIALAIAVPVGVAAAIFLSELAPPKLSDALTFAIELLAAVPSVIYGLVGLFIGVPLMTQYLAPALRAVFGWTPVFTGPFHGVSLLAAGIVLSVMTLPFIISVSRQVLLAVPNDQREGALALGATQWETTWRVVVPFARNGIIGSVFLALARALGETMAVTMVIGNQPQLNTSLFAPGYSIAAVIANEFGEAAPGLQLQTLILLGLVLFGLTIVINGVARLLVASTTRAASRAA